METKYERRLFSYLIKPFFSSLAKSKRGRKKGQKKLSNGNKNKELLSSPQDESMYEGHLYISIG